MVPIYLVWVAFDATGGAHPWPSWTDLQSWAVIIFTVLVAGYFADAKLNGAQRFISAPETQLILATAVPFSLLFAMLALGETITTVEYAAGACMIAGPLMSSVHSSTLVEVLPGW